MIRYLNENTGGRGADAALDFVASKETLEASLGALVATRRIEPLIARVFPLRDAVAAHEAFEGRQLVGRAVLAP